MSHPAGDDRPDPATGRGDADTGATDRAADRSAHAADGGDGHVVAGAGPRTDPEPRTGSAGDADEETRTGGSPWPLALGALLLGLLLGIGGTLLIAGAGGETDGATTAEHSPSPEPTPAQEPVPSPTDTGAGILVSQSCLDIADEAGQLTDILARGTSAAQDLDAARLSGLVREFGASQEQIQALADRCRVEAQAPGETPPGAATADPTDPADPTEPTDPADETEDTETGAAAIDEPTGN